MIAIEKFKNICGLSESKLMLVLENFLKSKYEKVIATEHYIIAVGAIPIALVAHVDTVFPELKKNIYFDSVRNTFWCPEGLGADDRAGVYAIIRIIESGLSPTVIFTTGEETGCCGAKQLVNDYPETITELKYMIELDRHGNNDCVFYDCYNKEFKTYIQDFGFFEKTGIYSDISILCPSWNIAGVNLSIGYYDEHTYIERLNFNELLRTIDTVKIMLESYETAPSFNFQSSGNKCISCRLREGEYVVKIDKGKELKMCLECISLNENVEWCEDCGAAFIDSVKQSRCVRCREG